jgi:hypothetical protein
MARALEAAGTAVGAGFGVVSRLRSARSLHPREPSTRRSSRCTGGVTCPSSRV